MPVSYIPAGNQAMHEEMARGEYGLGPRGGVAARRRPGRGVPPAGPVVVRGPCGAGVHGGLYHSQNPEAWFFHVPGLKVVAPATAYDAKGLLKAAIRDDAPGIYLEHKFL